MYFTAQLAVVYRQILKYYLVCPSQALRVIVPKYNAADNTDSTHHVQRSFRAWSQTSWTKGSYWMMIVFST